MLSWTVQVVTVQPAAAMGRARISVRRACSSAASLGPPRVYRRSVRVPPGRLWAQARILLRPSALSPCPRPIAPDPAPATAAPSHRSAAPMSATPHVLAPRAYTQVPRLGCAIMPPPSSQSDRADKRSRRRRPPRKPTTGRTATRRRRSLHVAPRHLLIIRPLPPWLTENGLRPPSRFCTGLSTAGRRTDCRSWHRRSASPCGKERPAGCGQSAGAPCGERLPCSYGCLLIWCHGSPGAGRPRRRPLPVPLRPADTLGLPRSR